MRHCWLMALIFVCFILPAQAVMVTVTYGDSAGEGFNDPTLGAARRNAFEAAASQWGQDLGGSVPVQINAFFNPQGGSSNSATLAFAGPETFFEDWNGTPQPNTFYAVALANQLADTDLDPGFVDITATFNSDVDGNVVLGNTHFYYGTDLQAGNDIDFYTVALHELCHGLGFVDTLNTNGAYFLGDPSVYDLHLANGSAAGATLISSQTQSQRAAALISNALFFSGVNTRAGNGNANARLYAPNPYEGGSSVSHLNEATFSPPPDGTAPNATEELMTPFTSVNTHTVGPVLNGIMKDLGWGFQNVALPTISINNISVNEGTAGTTNATLTVALSAASATNVTVKFATANGTAVAGSDYVAQSGTLTFTPGQTSRTIVIAVNGDKMVEPNETVLINLSAPSGATIADNQGIVTIINDDNSTISINNISVNEGDVGTTNATLTVTLSAASATNVTVNFATANGTAVAGSDYVAQSGTLTFTPGQTSRTIVVVVNGDTTVEPDETFFVDLSSPSGATLANARGGVTIRNDDAAPLPTLSINDVSISEGNSGTTLMSFTVSLSQDSAQDATVQFETANGTATAGSDYIAKSGTVTIPAGQTSGTISVSIVGDTIAESNDSVLVNLTNPTNATLKDSQGVGTILNDDVGPGLSINDVTVTEGNTGTVNATFTITLSAPSTLTASVNAIPFNGSARSPGDYVSGGARLVFDPGQTVKTFSVPIKGDLLDELDENIFVILSSSINATIARGRGIGTIIDDDAPPSITIDDVRIGEGNVGQRVAGFRLKLSAPSGQVVRVNYATGGGTATAGNDYDAVASTQIAFTTGNVFAYARVLINGDFLTEADETFFVNLSGATGATIADNQALGTILNDDSPPALTISDATITEGNSGTKNLNFAVTLSKPSGQTVTVNYNTVDGSARSVKDYVAKTSILSFPSGQTSKTISIVINGDTEVEGDETLFVLLSNSVNASIGRARGVGTILNDDQSN